MTVDNWQTAATAAFFVGMAAGLLLASILFHLGYKMGLWANLGEHAAKLAENARLQAETAAAERRLADLKARFGRTCAAIFNAEDAVEVAADGKPVDQ